MYYPSGDVYYGPYEKFKKEGEGYYYFSNGSKYVGDFKDGKINGYGKYYVDDCCVKKGIWKNGALVKEGSRLSRTGNGFYR